MECEYLVQIWQCFSLSANFSKAPNQTVIRSGLVPNIKGVADLIHAEQFALGIKAEDHKSIAVTEWAKIITNCNKHIRPSIT